VPLCFPLDPALPPSPKSSYRPHYQYLHPEGLDNIDPPSHFEIALRLVYYANLEPLLAAHIYVPSAKGHVPFHPVSIQMSHLCRREPGLSRKGVAGAPR